MTITSALQNALTGLRASGKLAEVTSNNLANALTPGYGRQSVVLGARVTGAEGTGVAVSGVDRALDPELTAARRVADGELAEGQARLDALTRLERAIGTVEDENSLVNRVAGFERSLRQLAETPESGPRQQAAAEAARDLAGKINQISTETAAVRQSADAEIARRVEEVNSALKKIAKLNRQIQIFTASGRETAALVDERERLIDKVAQNIPVRQSVRDDGVIELRTAEGLPLADIRAGRLNFRSAPAMARDARLENGVLSGLTLSGRDVTPTGTAAQRIGGGALSGLFEVRDRIAPTVGERVDSLAADLIARAQDSDPTRASGDPGFFTDGPGASAAFEALEPPTPVSGIANGVVTAPGHALNGGDRIVLDSQPGEIFRVAEHGGPDEFRLTTLSGDPVSLTGPSTQAERLADDGLAGRIALNPAVDPVAGGDPAKLRHGIGAASSAPSDPTVIRALADALAAPRDTGDPPVTQGLSGALSFSDRVAGVAEVTATARVASENETSALGGTRETLADEEAGALGVDSDAEMQRLVQIEQAYAANAQVIQTASRMLDQLLEIG